MNEQLLNFFKVLHRGTNTGCSCVDKLKSSEVEVLLGVAEELGYCSKFAEDKDKLKDVLCLMNDGQDTLSNFFTKAINKFDNVLV